MNKVQLLSGLSLSAFLGHYGNEAQCEQALQHARRQRHVYDRCDLNRDNAEVTQWDEAPLLATWKDREVSLRVGRCERVDADGVGSLVTVYMPDEFNEEAFQEQLSLREKRIAELHLQA